MITGLNKNEKKKKRWWNLCIEPGCTSSARGKTDKCITHGGGKRCIEPGCTSSAIGKTDKCVTHGGGARCIEPGCTSSAIGKTDKCITHGGGKRCESDACSIYDDNLERPSARHKGPNLKYYCYHCFNCKFPELVSHNGFIRQEHLILAEIQRLMYDIFKYAILCSWDCPIKCTLKKPDLLYELEIVYIIFEVDENGHNQSTERVLELRSALYEKPVIMFRINPNLSSRPLLKKIKRSNGESVWEATKYFDKAFIEFTNIVKNELTEFCNVCRNKDDNLLPYWEIAFNFNNKNIPKDRGVINHKSYGFKIECN